MVVTYDDEKRPYVWSYHHTYYVGTKFSPSEEDEMISAAQAFALIALGIAEDGLLRHEYREMVEEVKKATALVATEQSPSSS